MATVVGAADADVPVVIEMQMEKLREIAAAMRTSASHADRRTTVDQAGVPARSSVLAHLVLMPDPVASRAVDVLLSCRATRALLQVRVALARTVPAQYQRRYYT